MNFNKAQREVFNKIIGSGKPAWFDVDENNIFVTPDGMVGFIFPVSTIAFNLDRIRKMDNPVKIYEVVKSENELTLTNDIKLFPGRQARRLKKGKYSVFVDTRFLSYFQNPKFFQDKNDIRSPVIVTEFQHFKGDIPVGLIMPMKANGYEFGYYRDGGWEESEDAE